MTDEMTDDTWTRPVQAVKRTGTDRPPWDGPDRPNHHGVGRRGRENLEKPQPANEHTPVDGDRSPLSGHHTGPTFGGTPQDCAARTGLVRAERSPSRSTNSRVAFDRLKV